MNIQPKDSLVIYWSRRDFRLRDNPALYAALDTCHKQNGAFLPVFILEDYMCEENPEFQFGYPSQYFLSRALPAFGRHFDNFQIMRSKGAAFFKKLFQKYSQEFDIHIYVNEDVYPDFYTQVEKIRNVGISITVLPDQMTAHKDTVTGQGNMYSVFTPFKNAVWLDFVNSKESHNSQSLLRTVKYASADTVSRIFEDTLTLEHNTEKLLEVMNKGRTLKVGNHLINLDTISEKPDLTSWYWTKDEAHELFLTYLKEGYMTTYKEKRDSLEADTEKRVVNGQTLSGRTSKMSLTLAWGLISSRTLVSMVKEHYGRTFENPHASGDDNVGPLTFISELIWREFYKYLFYHRPELMHTEFQERFRGTITWTRDDEDSSKSEALRRFTAWIKGETGYPVVDAAMKQLAHTGWMHNRSRMIVASVLTKNLGVDWRWGQEYFRAALIDLDEASNNGGWQWAASVGADPKPIRIFNPYLQAQNHDANGSYERAWLGDMYEMEYNGKSPIVEHKDAREDALQRYGLTKDKGGVRDY